MTVFKTEAEALAAAVDERDKLNAKPEAPQYTLRILLAGGTVQDGFKALLVPAQIKWMSEALPFYL